MYNRLLHIDSDSRSSAFIFGPRGVGKTFWLKQHFPTAHYFDLLNDDTYTEFMARPSLLAERVPAQTQEWVIIDEIQKVPALLNEVHRLIETRSIRFILTGSSARTLRRKGVNLLAGRALTYHLYPLTTEELGQDFNLQRSLQFGHLPAAIHHEAPKHYLDSYIKTYLREEVLQEGITRNIGSFTRFLEVASFSQGAELNYSEIAREAALNRHTVANFFDILEDLLIAYRLPIFTRRAKRELVTRPKFYYFDVGVFRNIRPQGPLDSEEEMEGPALETLFLQEAKAMNEYFDWGYDIFYWRTRNKLEVDFVFYGKKGFHAVEIKRKRNLTPKDFRGLKEFSKDYPEATLTLLYGGSQSYQENNIQVKPFVEGLMQLKQMLAS